MPRTGVTQPPHLMVEGAIHSIQNKQSEAIAKLDDRYSTTNQWLEGAIESAKRKILEGSEISVSSHQIKKAKVANWKKTGGLSPIEDKENTENSPSSPEQNIPQQNSNAQEEYQKIRTRLKPPPSVVKRKVHSMKVVDLKKELKSKGQETKGLKKDLQTRLMEAYSTVEQIISPKKPENNTSATIQSNNDSNKVCSPVFEKTDDDESVTESVEIVFESMTKEDVAVATEGEEDAKPKASQKPDALMVEEAALRKEEVVPKVSVDSKKDPVVKESPVLEGDQESSTNAEKVSRVSDMDVEGSKSTSTTKDEDALEDAIVSKVYESKNDPLNDKRLDTATSFDDVSLMECDEPRQPSLCVDKNSKRSSEKMSLDVPPPPPPAVGKEDEETMEVKQVQKDGDQDRGRATKDETTSIESKTKQTEKEEGKESQLDTPNKNDSTQQQTTTQRSETQSPLQKITALFSKKTKSPAKAATPPAKASWLMKAKSDLKNVVSSEEEEKSDSSGNQKNELLTGKAMRRPGLGVGTASTSTSSSKSQTAVSAVKEVRKAEAEARKARLAHMREKTKPAVKQVTSASKLQPFTSALKAKSNTAIDAAENKQKNLLAKMREKAAANGASAAIRKEKTAPITSHGTKPAMATSATKIFTSKNVSQIKINALATAGLKNKVASTTVVSEAPAAQILKTKSTESQISKLQAALAPTTAEKSTSETVLESCSSAKNIAAALPSSASHAKKIVKSPPPRADVLMKKQLLSPMETYEISDREGSDSESESDSEDETKPRKKIPDWAMKSNLIPALEQQFRGADGKGRCDPDEIFSEVQTCDLQAIFNSKRSRYTRRTSSGNWTKDKVTAAEKLTYKRTMGFKSKASK